MLDAIRRRVSVRSYADRALGPDLLARVEAVLALAGAGPFGGVPRFALIERSTARSNEKVRLGTYGFIHGNPYFVAGAIARGPRAAVDYGYVFERVVLELTALGLGTCWLGGTFSRGEFARLLTLDRGEFVPAVSPLGFAAPGKGLIERVVRWGAKANDRLPWETLFFDGPGRLPLSPEAAGVDFEVLEAVRRGPSASNKQPWRVVRTGAAMHLFLERTAGYGRLVPGVDLQALDAGIAMFHLEAASVAQGRPGRWDSGAATLAVPAGWEYVAAWRAAHREA
jgi:nitroreductase